MTPLAAKALKVTMVLDAVAVAQTLGMLAHIEGRRIALDFTVDGRMLHADFAPKSIRKCLAMIRENGVEKAAVIVQGKLLRDDTIAEAGLVAQVKAPKPAVEVSA